MSETHNVPETPPPATGLRALIAWLTALWRGVRTLKTRLDDLDRRVGVLEEP